MKVILDDMPVRFTDDGRLFIIDAISALSGDEPAAGVWKSLLEDNPQVKDYVDYHEKPGDKPLPVTGSEGWIHIQDILFEHLTGKKDA